jgi:23S rRNA (cytosine1962-C5)-methyltransferase
LLSTYLKPDAAKRMRHGVPYVRRDEILRIDGTPGLGETVELRDENGELLGFGDVDLQATWAVRRLGLPEEPPDGIIQRHLRRALERRGQLIDDPRYCRLVNDDGDGLPGLVIDRFDQHYAVQTTTRAMDARVDEIARSLVEVMDARSVILRNDGELRAQLGLKVGRPHVLHGTPPRWTRVLDLGARFTIDLQQGAGTGFSYDHRQVKKLIARMAHGARVLDVSAFVGGLFVHAGLHGAKQIIAFERNEDAAELARENAEANGLLGKAWIENADGFTALSEARPTADLTLVNDPELRFARDGGERFLELVRRSVRATRHGGRMIVIGYHPPLHDGPSELDDLIARACESEGRIATRLGRPSLPADFPTVIGSPGGEHLHALAVELS